MDLYSLQISWIKSLQEGLSSTFWQTFFKSLNFLDTFGFYFLLIFIFWTFVGKKVGIRLYYLVILLIALVQLAKALILEPRPFFIDPSVGLIEVKGYGFPSGAAAAAMLFSICFIWQRPKAWAYILAISYLFLVSFSRVYLGVHFFLDILGGWFLGAILAFLFIRFYKPVENFLGTHSIYLSFALSQVFGFLLFLIPSMHIAVPSSAVGIGMGLFLEKGLIGPKLLAKYNLKEKLLQFWVIFFGILTIFIFKKLFTLFLFFPLFIDSMSYLLMGIWISFGVNLILNKIKTVKIK